MPYFSFSLKQIFLKMQDIHFSTKNIEEDQIYYSKNTYLWKILNKVQNKPYLNFVKFESRNKIKKISGRVLFCLPPSIGLGDAIEYALAFKAISEKKILNDFSIAFRIRFKIIFKNYFKLYNIYNDLVPKLDLDKFDTIFHLTLEIPQLKFQKYVRSDIEDLLTKYFNVEKIRKNKIKPYSKIKRISIFPVSNSPIRSMTVQLLENFVSFFQQNYQVEIIFDDSSIISNYLEKNLKNKNYIKYAPTSIKGLCEKILDTDFGIFMDSGPLHFAKSFNIRGVLITSSVDGKVLLNNFNSIKIIDNSFESSYCKSPCGLTNLFNWNSQVGCYDFLNIEKNDLVNTKNLNSLQRGGIKNEYLNFMDNPVKCLKHLDGSKIIQEITNILEN